MRKKRLCAGFTTLIMLIVLLLPELCASAADKEENTTVRVGYFQMDGYNEISQDGVYSGYDYDFFQLLSRYTDLNFTFVGYDKSWQEMQEMLENGEIDVLTSMHTTSERRNKYNFSYDIGTSYTILTVKSSSHKLQSGDYSSYEGMRVGMLTGSSQNDNFEQFAQENDFSYVPVYFDNIGELTDAVQSETVDAAVTSSLRLLNGERILEEISPEKFYAVVTKENTELLSEINQGIAQMDLYEDDWRDTLYNRYYSYSEDEEEIIYSEREQSVMKEYSGDGSTLRICFSPSLPPYSFVEDGEMVGILPDAVREMLDGLGLNYEYVIPEDQADYERMYLSGEADIFPEITDNISAEAQQKYLFTDAYFAVRLGLLTRKSGRTYMGKIAVLNDQNFYENISLTDSEMISYDSLDDLVQAIVDGDADAAYLMNYTAQMYINREKLGELTYVSQPDLQYELRFAVNHDLPHEICSILNKNVSTLQSMDFSALSIFYVENDFQNFTLMEYMQLHPKIALMIFVMLIVILVIFMVMIFVNVQRIKKRHLEAEREIEREKQQHMLEQAYEKTEAALAEAQQYRHAVLSDAIVVYDANITCNLLESEVFEEYGERKVSFFKTFALMVPCNYEEYIKKILSNLIVQEDIELFREKTSREYLLSLYSKGRMEDVVEYRSRILDGRTADIRRTTYLTCDEHTGNVIAHINIKNISEQKKNEQNLRKYEQILITIASDNYKGVRRIDLETGHSEYIYFKNGRINQGTIGDWTEWLKRQKGNIHPEDYERICNFLSIESMCVMQEGNPVRQNYRSRQKYEQGIYRVYSTTVSVIHVGKKKIALATTMDNTEAVLNEMEQKRQIEDALQLAENASRAKTVFLSNMSHDIRTPMNAIIGFTSLAKTYIDNTDRVRDYLEKISDSSMHLLSLVNDVLDMSRIESGRLHLDPTPCSLSDLMHNLRNILLPDIRERQLTFLMETENITDENVICDRLRLNQVLLNLIGNAMKFTPAGGSVTVELRELQGETENVPIYEFTVQDTGIGMSKAFVEHVFEAFERERNSTVSGIQGTGLGMSITKSIVDMMNGTISVQSVQGEGSTFTVRIPMQRVICENTENCSSQALHGIRALIVGEDSAACRSIASMLVQLGMEADFCVPEEAVRNIRMENGMHYGACLLDWRLPEQYEIETIRKIRHETEAPILLLSAYDFGDTEEAKKAGVTEFVPRPLFLSDLQRLLLNALYPEEENTPQPAIVRRIHGQRILLVEDNDLNREIAVEILRGAGFLVEEAENGSVAVEMIQKGGAGYYQLVLMDIQMPIMDGYTAAKTIRALEDKELSAIPIVAMTANAFAEDKQKAIAAGMNAHIAKPISVDNLLDTLEELLN